MATVLIVDDSKFSRLLIARALKHAGHAVLEASDGHDGLQVIRSQGVDCVVTDLIMPVLDGSSFIRKLRGAGVRAPVIVHSADDQASTRSALLATGTVASFVAKSDGAQALLAAVDAAINVSLSKEAA